MLKTGDLVSVFSPSGHFEVDRLKSGIKEIESWGVKVAYEGLEQSGYFAGTDAARSKQLKTALNSGSNAFIAARGGFGLNKIIEEIAPLLKEIPPSIFIGFSDLTPLINLVVEAGHLGIHGPMAVQYGTFSKIALNNLKALLFDPSQYELRFPNTPFNVGTTIEGKVVGGNLCMLADSIGTPTEIPTNNRILLLEEVGEPLYRVDRMMLQLKRAGKLNQIKGAIVGQFTNCQDTGALYQKEAIEVIRDYLTPFDIPLAFGAPLGHEKDSMSLPLGVPIKMEMGEDSTKITIA